MTYQQQQPERTGPNRRKVILTGAGIAAAGVVVGAGVPLVSSQLSEADSESGGPVAAPKDPVMVHLRNADQGTFDVFVGTNRVQVTDRGFAARLSSAASKAEGE